MKWYVTPLIDTLMPDYTTPIVTHIIDDTCQDIYGPPPEGSPQYEPGMIHPSATNAWNFPGEGGEQALYTPFDPPSISPPPDSACHVEGCWGKCMQNGNPHDEGSCQTYPCTSSGCRGRWIGSSGHRSTCKHDTSSFHLEYLFRWDPIIITDVGQSAGVTGGWLPIATASGLLGGMLLGGVAAAVQPLSTLAAALQYQAQAAAQRRRDA